MLTLALLLLATTPENGWHRLPETVQTNLPPDFEQLKRSWPDALKHRELLRQTLDSPDNVAASPFLDAFNATHFVESCAPLGGHCPRLELMQLQHLGQLRALSEAAEGRCHDAAGHVAELLKTDLELSAGPSMIGQMFALSFAHEALELVQTIKVGCPDEPRMVETLRTWAPRSSAGAALRFEHQTRLALLEAWSDVPTRRDQARRVVDLWFSEMETNAECIDEPREVPTAAAEFLEATHVDLCGSLGWLEHKAAEVLKLRDELIGAPPQP